MNVHILHPPKAEHLDYLKSKLDADIQLTSGDDVPKDTHLLIAGRPQREHLTHKPHLHTLIIPFTGLPTETAELMRDFRKIAIHNLHHNAPMTAEMALTLLMAAARNIVPVDRGFRQHDWTVGKNDQPITVLNGKTALILGYGAVGQAVGRMCWAMGMQILAIRKHVAARASTLVKLGAPDKLHDWLPQANVLIICLPGTPETEGLIGEKELKLLPKGAILVNVGRGSIVDQTALYNSLKEQHLAGAGLDVWYNYPEDEAARKSTQPSDFSFHELDNVVMSPHRAGGAGTAESEQRRMDALSESLNAAVRNLTVPNKVDLKLGY